MKCRIKTSDIIRWIWTLWRVMVTQSQGYVFPLMREVWQQVKKKSSFFVQLNVYLCLLMFMIHSILLELELWMYYVGGKFVLVLYGHSFAWNMSPLCQMWVIWKERNGWNFNSVEDFSYGVGNFVFLECCLSAGGNF